MNPLAWLRKHLDDEGEEVIEQALAEVAYTTAPRSMRWSSLHHEPGRGRIVDEETQAEGFTNRRQGGMQ